ncbi:DNA-directed RNA polymerase subunit delta [Alicyclobacillus acidiphilus]|uniref:DNA-directed RNA polymerase subunit delta n=1 Tax=Alicyclobacillus acidiphilus TaxID=182455 RepID=UPI00082A14EC|nr:DNA-directed RNA polymerase subunit delta [Alicyclobacillus acidiphilus]
MAVSLARPDHEIQQMPLVELVYEILRAHKEPLYFRDIMKEIQALRKMTDDEVAEVIARVFTEINVDGRFVCIGQNVWGLNRWYPTDRANERTNTKKFVRKTGDAFGDDDEDEEEFEEDVDELDEDEVFGAVDTEEDAEFDAAVDEEEEDTEDALDEDEEFEEEPLFDEDEEDEEEEED